MTATAIKSSTMLNPCARLAVRDAPIDFVLRLFTFQTLRSPETAQAEFQSRSNTACLRPPSGGANRLPKRGLADVTEIAHGDSIFCGVET